MKQTLLALLTMLLFAPSAQALNFCISTSSIASAYSCDLPSGLSAYTIGDVYSFRANGANADPATLALNGLPPVAIVKTNGNQLSVNDIRNNQVVVVVFDGSNMQMISPLGNEPVPSGLRLLSTLSAGCPTGWREDTAARGRYLVGTPSGATVGNTLGTAMTQTGGTVDDSSYTPAGTNSAPAFTGTAATLTNNTATVAAGSTFILTIAGSSTTYTPAGTVAAPTFTGTAAATMRSTVAPVLQIIICSKN